MSRQLQESVDSTASSRDVLARIVASQTFSRSPRLRDLLLDIGEHTLSGQTDDLREQAIGVRVFGREESYNPSEDNIVRSSVRQLRAKLAEYYQTEGLAEPTILEIPKGSYNATFSPRSAEIVVRK